MKCETSRMISRSRRAITLAFRQRGFTLIEIMVVVVILGVMARLIVPKVFDRIYDAQRIKAMSDMSAIKAALTLYQLDNFNLPTIDEGLQALATPPREDMPMYRNGGYIDRDPIDPWGNPYVYVRPGQHGEFDIVSLGRDGQSGGEDKDSDIGSWMNN